MEKKSRGKNIVIVILVLVVLGLVGYIVYDKYTFQNKILDYEKQIDNLKKQIDENHNSNESLEQENQVTKLNGYYKTGQIYSTDDNQCDPENLNQKHGESTEILFKEDGTYKSFYAADCGGGYAGDGTYSIAGDKLVLKCNDPDGPCVGGGEYKIENNGNIVSDRNDIYLKIDKSQLQLLK